MKTRIFSVLGTSRRTPELGVIVPTLDAAIAVAREEVGSGRKVAIWERAESSAWFTVTLVVNKRNRAAFIPIPDSSFKDDSAGPPMQRGRKDPSVYVPTYGQPEDDLDLSDVSAFEPCPVCSGCEIDLSEPGRCAEHT